MQVNDNSIEHLTFIESPKYYRCPKCGYESNDITGIMAIEVSIPQYEGKYCLACYAKWINETFPKLEEVNAGT